MWTCSFEVPPVAVPHSSWLYLTATFAVITSEELSLYYQVHRDTKEQLKGGNLLSQVNGSCSCIDVPFEMVLI